LTFIVSNSKEESPPEPQIVKGTKLLKVHFQCTPIDLNGEMEDMEELGGINVQLKTSQ
jgi:hypothetical protein